MDISQLIKNVYGRVAGQFRGTLSAGTASPVCNTRNVIISVVALAGEIMVYRAVVSPHKNYLAATENFASVVVDVSEKKKTVEAEIHAKTDQLKTLQEDLTRKRSTARFYTAAEGRAFFEQIRTIAHDAGCTVESLEVQPDAGGDDGGLRKQSSMLVVGGGFGDVAELLRRLQDQPDRVLVDNLIVESPPAGQAGGLRCRLRVTVWVNYDPEGDDVESDSDA